MADQCEATESELSFHTRCTEGRESKFQRGIWCAHALKDLGKTFHELNKLAQSVVKGNFGGIRERPNYCRIGEICPMLQRSMVRAKTAIIRRLSPKMSIVHPWMVSFDLPMPHEVFDLLNKEIRFLV